MLGKSCFKWLPIKMLKNEKYGIAKKLKLFLVITTHDSGNEINTNSSLVRR